MSDEAAHESLPADAHTDAATAFVDRARSRHGDFVAELYIFGSTIRGDANGRVSDVLIVLDDDTDLSDAAVINRLDRGFDPTSHGEVLSLFGSEIIADGDAQQRDGRFFSQLSELRQQADYNELDENVDWLHSRTKQPVSEMEALCTSSD